MRKLTSWLVPLSTPLRPLLVGLAIILALSSTAKIQLSDNVLSRAAAMLAITENHQLELGPWRDLTVDWARTPEGSYFSNKAPGPIILGLVLFYPLYKTGKYLLQKLDLSEQKNKKASDLFLMTLMWILSLAFQLFPMVWFVSRTLIFLNEKCVAVEGQIFFLVGALFSNTGAFFLSSYFGHGFALAATLGVFYFLLEGKYGRVGLFLGLAILGDYSCFFLIPAVIVYLLLAQGSLFFSAAFQMMKGAVLPMTVMAVYHWLCFGSPLNLPQKFQNPSMVWDTGKKALWGVVSFLPSNYTLWELMLGSRKGILVTQPYILFLLGFLFTLIILWTANNLFRQKRREIALGVAVLVFFGGVFCMNAGFNAWWGGGTPGPRYLSAAFVPLILAGALLWNSWPKMIQIVLLVGLGIAFLFSLLSISVGDLPSMEPLWSYMVWRLTDSKDFLYLDLRLMIFAVIAIVSFVRTRFNQAA